MFFRNNEKLLTMKMRPDFLLERRNSKSSRIQISSSIQSGSRTENRCGIFALRRCQLKIRINSKENRSSYNRSPSHLMLTSRVMLTSRFMLCLYVVKIFVFWKRNKLFISGELDFFAGKNTENHEKNMENVY